MTINPGDIAFVGVNSVDPDEFAFVVKNSIAGGDTFFVTDGGYTGATTGIASAYFRSTEGYLQYTAPAAGLPAGSVILVTAGGGTAPSVARNGGGAAGTVALLANSGGATNNFTFSTAGDSLTVYTVSGGTHLTGTPTLVAFIGFGPSPYGTGSAQASSTPTITNGQVLALANLDDAIVKNPATAYNLTIAQLSNASNFNQQDATRYDLTSISSLPAATTPTVDLSVNSANGSEATPADITITATASSAVTSDRTLTLTVTGTGITTGDYTLNNTTTNTVTITIPSGLTTGTATFRVVDDTLAEGSETATLTISNPSSGITIGTTAAQNITITDNDGVVANNAPTIVADNETAIDLEKVTVFLNAPNSSPVGAPTAFISGVINDSTDPAKSIGIEFNIADAETTSSALAVTATSSNQSVVTDANLTVANRANGNSRNLKINPTGVGYSDITVTVSDGTATSSYVIKYAASAAGATTTRALTGASNASTAIAIDSNYMLVGDDENQALRLYDRNNSGLAVNSFDFTTSLGLTQTTSGGAFREVDIEAAARLNNRIFWMGSQSNTDPEGTPRSNRNRIFATDISGTGVNTTLAYVNRYDYLREDIIDWDVNNTHGKGANYYGLAASAAANVSSKKKDGYNIEGLEFAPDNTTAYVAFRAPQEPTGTFTKALIVPVTNFTTLLSANGGTQGTSTFGAPIELDLGGRGIREIRKNAANQYVIIAGSAGTEGVAPNDFQLYTWTGNPTDAPLFRTTDLTALNVGGSFESIVEVPTTLTNTSQLQLLVDNGSTVFYNDGQDAKSVPVNFQKSRSEIVALGNSIVKIHDIQGAGTTAALTGSQSIEGIVTRAFTGTGKLNGFYVQEEDADADSNTATSEAIFVFDTSGTAVNVGDKVRVTGTVKEFTSTTSSLTELDTLGVTSNIVNLSAGNLLPTITNIQLPVVSATALERYEGMLVNISAGSGDLTVTENFQLGRFGQVVLAANSSSNQPGTDARFDQYTQFNAPSVPGYTAYVAEQATRRIYLDDGSGTQNGSSILFGRGGDPLSATNTLRSGDTVSNITGILDERFEGYRIQTTDPVNFVAANARPATPPAVGGTLRVANFNILNYFTDLLPTPSTTFVNDSGASLNPRGANTAAEFIRQRDKIIQAIITSDADVLGLNEVENNGFGATSAIQNLVNGLNAVAGSGTYAFINPGVNISTDAITVGMIYKPGKVTPVGNAATMPLGYSAAFDLVGRRPLAQTFQQNSNQATFTAVVNHLKSKGSSSGGIGDADINDGQGFSNGTRTRQAQALATWLATKPTGATDTDYVILGDLNAYAKEDPLTALATAGYNNLLSDTSYSYVFNGQAGSLDHALGSNSLASQTTGADKWHINADEPTALDYEIALFNNNVLTNIKTASQISSLYAADQYRSSDHDPVIVGLNLRPGNTVGGTPLDDILTGTNGDDDILGFAGNDILRGGSGNNNLDGGAGNDVLYSSLTGKDTLAGGAGDDVYEIHRSDDTISESLGGGNDTIWTDTTYTMSANIETMYLVGSINGTGSDDDNTIVVYGGGTHSIDGGEGNDTLIAGTGTDTLIGGGGNDVLRAGSGTNSLEGGAGNDVLYSSLTGLSTLAGGAGNDIYEIHNPANTIVEGAGGGTDTIWTDTSYTMSANIETMYLVGNINGTGSDDDNTIVVYGGGTHSIDGKAGNDTLIAGTGTDKLIGGEGNDVLRAGSGTDSLEGGEGNDVLYSSLTGLATLAGGAGDDVYEIHRSDNTIVENAGGGTDTIWTDTSYTMSANIETMYLVGNINGTGSDDDNTIVGYGVGDNFIDGGLGDDTLYGGAGNDVFMFSGAALLEAVIYGVDTIGDFTVDEDKIQLNKAAFSALNTSGATLTNYSLSNPNGDFSLVYNTTEQLAAESTNAKIIYNSQTGGLFYNANGTESGFGPVNTGGQFALLNPGLLMSGSDFFAFSPGLGND
jgi:predicted extracellular nuclease